MDSQNLDLIHVRDIIVSVNLNLNSKKPKESIPLIITVSLSREFGEAGTLDDLGKSIDYSQVAKVVRNLTEGNKQWTSFEELAQEICRICIFDFGAKKIQVRLKQARAFFNVASAGIQVVRTAEDLLNSNCDAQLVSLNDDILFIEKLCVSTIIGVLDFEREEPQQLETNFEIYSNRNGQPGSDGSKQLQDIVVEFSEYLKASSFGTVEALINSLAILGLEKFKFLRIKVRIDKPNAIPWADAASVEVDHDQNWLRKIDEASPLSANDETIVLLGIGSNLGSPIKNINLAMQLLSQNKKIKITDTSFLYETTPMYFSNEPNYLNGAIKISTILTPEDLLKAVKLIEAEVKRTESVQHTSNGRLIDLDILFYDNLVIEAEALVIPRPDILQCEYVMRPLCDISKTMRHPKSGLTLEQLLSRLLKSERNEGGIVIDKVLPMHRGKTDILWKWNQRTLIMGILNISADSFSDAGRPDLDSAVAAAEKMSNEGADIIGISGIPRKPGADEEAKSTADEITSLVPLIRALRAKKFLLPISVNTVHAEVAAAVVEAGADIINDFSGGTHDPAMLSTIARLGVPYIITHKRGNAVTMLNNENTDYSAKGVIAQVREELENSVAAGISAGIYRWNIILDAGLGLAKHVSYNCTTIRDHKLLTTQALVGFPTLLAPSSENFTGTVTGVFKPGKRGYGTAGAVAASVAGGANIIRVHDVKEMLEVTRVADAVWKQGNTI